MAHPRSELRARVLLAASQQPAPLRDRVRRRNAWLLLSAAAVPLLVFAAFGGVRAAPRPPALVLQTSLGAGAIALGYAVLAFSRGRSTLGRARLWLVGVAVSAPLALLGWKIVTSAFFEHMMESWPTRVGLRCLGLSCLVAAWPLIAMAIARRGSDPVQPGLTGAALGAAVGACSWVLVDLNCPVAYVPHLLLGHVLPLLLATLAGAGLGQRLIALRGR